MPEHQLRVSYDPDVRMLNITTADRGVTSTSLEHDYDVIADLDSEDSPCKVAALEILDPSNYLPFGTHGCNERTDTLLFGSKEEATTVEANGDLVAYWKPDLRDPAGSYIPLGVEVLSARKWLTGAPICPSRCTSPRSSRGSRP